MAQAIETREARIKEFAFRVRAATAGTAGAGGRIQALKTDEVVREMQLPEFKLDLAALQGLLAPQRKLQPRRKQQQFKQTGMPERMELAVTLQRANYLPTR
jgi:coiled-coil and C2 domain-containing protein 2A